MEYEEFLDQEREMTEECEPCEEEYTERRKGKRKIEVDEVLGTGEAETTLEVCIPLVPPAFEIMEDIIKRDIEFDALVAGDGKVFINARVIKNIPFKTKLRTVPRNCCGLITKITFGDIRHVTVEVPFALCIDVPESVKGARVEVLEKKVESVEIPNRLSCNSRLIKSITEKDCVFVKVKVVRDAIICVPAKEY